MQETLSAHQLLHGTLLTDAHLIHVGSLISLLLISVSLLTPPMQVTGMRSWLLRSKLIPFGVLLK